MATGVVRYFQCFIELLHRLINLLLPTQEDGIGITGIVAIWFNAYGLIVMFRREPQIPQLFVSQGERVMSARHLRIELERAFKTILRDLIVAVLVIPGAEVIVL